MITYIHSLSQLGAISRSNTTHALISMIHSWSKSTDGNGATTRVVLFDFRKAFDLVNHRILVEKISEYTIPRRIICWIVDFLMDRKQRVKLSNDCYSEWGAVPAGVPQGTKLGPWLFIIMINGLNVENVDLWKYVDDSSLVENVAKGETSCMQKYADEFSLKASVDGFQLNETKCKELRINFSNYPVQFEPITINGKEIEVVPSARVLGLKISSDLKWNPHIEDICKKVASRLYFLRQLKRAQLTAKDMLLFYITCIRPTIEYACQVFHTGLPQYLSDDLESLQKRALRIIYPDFSYNEALNALDLTTLFERRQILNDRLFKEIVEDSSHKLNNLLPSRNSCTANLRKRRLFQLPICKTNRFKNTFIPYNLYNSSIN